VQINQIGAGRGSGASAFPLSVAGPGALVGGGVGALPLADAWEDGAEEPASEVPLPTRFSAVYMVKTAVGACFQERILEASKFIAGLIISNN
jgi:hypothetical protein